MKIAKILVSTTAGLLCHVGSAADFRDFPSIFKTERISIPVSNISCALQETAAAPGGFPGVKAVVTVSGHFINSDRRIVRINPSQPLQGSLLRTTMAVARSCEDFLAELDTGESVVSLRQGRELLLATKNYSVLALK